MGGTVSTPVTYNAATNSAGINFTATVGTASFITITNFNASDSLAISGGGSNTLVVANRGADVVLTVNANGVVTQITLVGVTTPSVVIGSLAAFNALGIGQVTYH